MDFQKDGKINDEEMIWWYDWITTENEPQENMVLTTSPGKYHVHAATHHIHQRDVLLLTKPVLIVAPRTILPDQKPAGRFPSRSEDTKRNKCTLKVVQQGIGTFIIKMRSQQRLDSW